MSFQDIFEKEAHEYMSFKDFWPIFCEHTNYIDTRKSFELLLREGLALRYRPLGFVYDHHLAHSDNINIGLNRMERHNQTMNQQKLKFDDGVGGVLETSLSDLLIKRGDIELVYSELGLGQYPWQTEAVGDIGTVSHAPEKRQNQLHLLIWNIDQASSQQKRLTAQQIWNEIQHRHDIYDTDKIIQEVNGEQILWCSGYGNEQKQLRRTFDKTLSTIRKSYR